MISRFGPKNQVPRPLLGPTSPLWAVGLLSSVKAASTLTDIAPSRIEELITAGAVRTEIVLGELRLRVDDLLTASLQPLGPPAPAPPLVRRVADCRRRRGEGVNL
jgi:hypothetical protein